MHEKPCKLVLLVPCTLSIGAAFAAVAMAAAAPAAESRPRIKPAGYLQGDLRRFPGWEVEPGFRDDGGDVRRLRVGVEMESGPYSGEIVVEAADLVNRALGDRDHQPAFALKTHLKDAYLQRALGRHYVRAGQFKLPVSREHLTSAARTDFIERSRIGDGLAPGRDWGLMAGGKLGGKQGLEYRAGVFAGDGWSEHSRAKTTGAARLVWEPVPGLELAGSGSLATVKANVKIHASQPRGLHGESLSDWTFFPRPFVEGQRRRLGGDLRLERGPLKIKLEVLQSRDERKAQGSTFEDLPAVVGLGWSAGAEWRLLGPRSKDDTTHGRTPLDVGVRYEALRFDDEGGALAVGPESPGLRAANVFLESLASLSVGVAYEPRSYLRLMGNVALDRYGGAGQGAPEPGRLGTYLTVLGRLQVHVP